VEQPKRVAEMIGEMLREAAVLVIVFVPLDVLLFFYASFGWKEIVLVIDSTAMVGAIFGALGIWMERTRSR
jgi:hypothetical protein